MVAKNVDDDHPSEVRGGSRYGRGRGRNEAEIDPSVQLYGRLSEAVVNDLQRNYGGFSRVKIFVKYLYFKSSN